MPTTKNSPTTFTGSTYNKYLTHSSIDTSGPTAVAYIMTKCFEQVYVAIKIIVLADLAFLWEQLCKKIQARYFTTIPMV